eukprot:IDg13390t1
MCRVTPSSHLSTSCKRVSRPESPSRQGNGSDAIARRSNRDKKAHQNLSDTRALNTHTHCASPKRDDTARLLIPSRMELFRRVASRYARPTLGSSALPFERRFEPRMQPRSAHTFHQIRDATPAERVHTAPTRVESDLLNAENAVPPHAR